MSVLTTVARVAIPLVIGGVVGYQLSQAEEQTKPRPKQPPHGLTNDKLKKRLTRAAHDILFSDNMPKDDAKLEDYLQEQYRALYLIGRCGKKLKSENIDTLAAKLRHLHHMHKPRRDKKIVNWYETVGVSNDAQLADLLAACPLLKGCDTRYIAAALGVYTGKLDFSRITEEVVQDFIQ